MLAPFISLLFFCKSILANNLTSSKRGLVYTYAEPADGNGIWDSSDSDLTWYYDYAAYPVDSFDDSRLHFVPMLWGAGPQYAGFSATVTGLMSSGMDIEHILAFNEPDLCGPKSQGGSCIAARQAARIWQDEIEPLKKHGIKLGTPATTQGGLWWMQEFFTACAGRCSADFMPIHYYGDFPGLASYVGLVRETYPNMTIWVTEFALPNATVLASEQFYNESVAYLDSLSYVTRYSYFGSFRADDASPYVGPNGTMLNDAGELTDIGAWYLGENATGRGPQSGGAPMDSPTTWSVLVILVLMWTAFVSFG